MFTIRVHLPVLLALAILPSVSQGQGTPVEPPTTLWRFMGIPQGFQKIRDVVTNRRGNRPGLERRDPIKRIADPANLESPNDAIKTAAKIKQAEDMKMQKIKAIKYLAKVGCGCYNADGEITKALLAATTDCTPDVRKAAIEAIEDAAGNPCCNKCGSTSCCGEEINKRLSEMAYERGDDGCPIEPNAEIRRAAARALQRCCPGGPPTGPILEEAPEEEIPTPAPVPSIPGEGSEEEMPIPGESGEDVEKDKENEENDEESTSNQLTRGMQRILSFENPLFRFHSLDRKVNVDSGEVHVALSEMHIEDDSDFPIQELSQPIRFPSESPETAQVVNVSGASPWYEQVENAPAPVRAIPLPTVRPALPKLPGTTAISTDRNDPSVTGNARPVSPPREVKPLSAGSEKPEIAIKNAVERSPEKVNRIPLPLR